MKGNFIYNDDKNNTVKILNNKNYIFYINVVCFGLNEKIKKYYNTNAHREKIYRKDI